MCDSKLLKMAFHSYLFLCTIHTVYSANILTASIFPSYSHQVVYQGVWKELALRGHQVTSITTNPIADPSIVNLKEIDISFTYDIWNKERSALKTNKNPKDVIAEDIEIFAKMSRGMLALQEVQDLKNSSFDLVIAEWIYPALFGFSAVFKCPLVGINSIDLTDTLSTDIGNPVHPIVHPGFILPFKTANTIWERLKSVEISLWMRYLYHYSVYPISNEIIQTYMGEDLPSVKDIIHNVSMVFVNSNFLFSKPRGNLPNVIEFSGLHIKKPEPLSQDVQTFLDNATKGVIYFSLGSYIKSNMLSKELKTIIIETFSELPYKILWKFEDQNFSRISSNVKISTWLPQQDILAHKNVKVFITQGGLQSTEEAIRKRVPMVGIPFILDQPRNIEALTKLGIAKYVDKSTITKESFKKAIIEVAETIMYRQKINELADLLEDEPMKGLEKVIWWIEYVLRHKGAQHLRSPFLDIPWYQYLLLDVLAFIVFSSLAALFIVVWLLKVTWRVAQRMQKQKGE